MVKTWLNIHAYYQVSYSLTNGIPMCGTSAISGQSVWLLQKLLSLQQSNEYWADLPCFSCTSLPSCFLVLQYIILWSSLLLHPKNNEDDILKVMQTFDFFETGIL